MSNPPALQAVTAEEQQTVALKEQADSEAEQLHTALKQSVKKRKAMDVESAMQVPARPCPSPLSPTQYPR